jgi:hypothetical protein
VTGRPARTRQVGSGPHDPPPTSRSEEAFARLRQRGEAARSAGRAASTPFGSAHPPGRTSRRGRLPSAPLARGGSVWARRAGSGRGCRGGTGAGSAVQFRVLPIRMMTQRPPRALRGAVGRVAVTEAGSFRMIVDVGRVAVMEAGSSQMIPDVGRVAVTEARSFQMIVDVGRMAVTFTRRRPPRRYLLDRGCLRGRPAATEAVPARQGVPPWPPSGHRGGTCSTGGASVAAQRPPRPYLLERGRLRGRTAAATDFSESWTLALDGCCRGQRLQTRGSRVPCSRQSCSPVVFVQIPDASQRTAWPSHPGQSQSDSQTTEQRETPVSESVVQTPVEHSALALQGREKSTASSASQVKRAQARDSRRYTPWGLTGPSPPRRRLPGQRPSGADDEDDREALGLL